MTDAPLPRNDASGRTILVWPVLVALLLTAGFTLEEGFLRSALLRLVLVGMALGEALGAFLQIFRARLSAPLNGRTYSPDYHDVQQDFGFYNLAFAILFTLAALEPERNSGLIAVAILFYAIHGVTHLLRYLGLYYGGGGPLATRPRRLELRDALVLLTPALGLALFFP